MFFTYGFEKKAKEIVRGGKADGHKDSEYPAEQIRKGQKIEKEHTGDPALAREIARDHLEEDKEKGINPPNYYDRLEKVEKKAFDLGFSKAARELTTKSRNKLPDASFVFPRERRYPIHDEAHARNALARVSQFGTKSEKGAVRAAVHSRYPGIGKEAAANANWEEPTTMVPMPGKKGVEAMAQPPMWPSGVSPIVQSTFVD